MQWVSLDATALKAVYLLVVLQGPLEGTGMCVLLVKTVYLERPGLALLCSTSRMISISYQIQQPCLAPSG